MKPDIHLQAVIGREPRKQECIYIEECTLGEKIKPITMEELKKYVIPIYNKGYWTKVGYNVEREPNSIIFNCDVNDGLKLVNITNWVLYDKELVLLLDNSYKTWAIEVLSNFSNDLPNDNNLILPHGLHGFRRVFYIQSEYSVPSITSSRQSTCIVKELRRKKQGKRHIKNHGCTLDGGV